MPTPHLRRSSGRSRRRVVSLLAIPALVAPMLITAGASPASAEPIDTGLVASVPAHVGTEPVAVTLITGDTVYWQDNGSGGAAQVVKVEESPRDDPVTFDQYGTPQDFYVIPSDIRAYVADGVIDRGLFNIPRLISQGLDDESTDQIPVIVAFQQDRNDQQLVRDAKKLFAASNARAIDHVNGAGVRLERDRTTAIRKAVLDRLGQGSVSAPGAGHLVDNVERIVLDEVLQVDLAESGPQIGAPEAWDAGFTGEGVTVAVLDTGVDSSHPDLAGKVVAAENFTDEPDASDGHGHGTHVASTIAGTGAASDGARMGVAPGAELVIGKVCTADGECQTSEIMAGMEWAVTQGADIVNMSLGGGPTDGTDPLSELLNQLSRESDTLFVTSAGNNGCCQQVGTPGAADAALTVGAVDKRDQLAWFSSRGPRAGDHAVKPEITGPGVAIEAARAAGTAMGSPVDDDYTAANGTSMASPHVAGAAALLVQSRPSLSSAELKDVLVTTAADGGFRWNEQGTGRIDIPSALGATVYADGTINFGGIDDQAQKSLTYTNSSNTDVTLSLDVQVTDWEGKTVEGVTVADERLVVPARSQKGTTITISESLAATGDGPFGGVVIASDPSGTQLRTGIGFGPPLNKVTIDVLDSKGRHTGTDVAPDRDIILIHDTYDPEQPVGSPQYVLEPSDGTAVGHVPTGVYTIITEVIEADPDTGEFTRGTVLSEVEVRVASDAQFTLDSRNAIKIGVTVPRKVDKRNHEVAVIREFAGHGLPGTVFTYRAGGAQFPVFAVPTDRPQIATFALWVHWTLAEPQPIYPLFEHPDCPRLPFRCYSETPAYVYNLPFLYENGIPRALHERVRTRDLVRVRTWYHADRPGVLILQQFHAVPRTGCACGGGTTQRLYITPGRTNEYMLADDRMTWIRVVAQQYRTDDASPTFTMVQRGRDRFPAAEGGDRRSDEHWFASPLRVGAADIREEYLDNPINELRPALGSRGGADGNQFMPGLNIMDNTRGHGVISSEFASWRMWNLNTGTELASGLDAFPVFPLADEEATYRLEQITHMPAAAGPLFQTGPTTTTWTFTSRPSDSQVPVGYTCPLQEGVRSDLCQIQPIIQLEYDFNLDIYNQASARRVHAITITAGHHTRAIARAPVVSLAVQASYDDGATWQPARYVGRPIETFDTGGYLPASAPYRQFLVLLRTPRLDETSGYVTLRVTAKDANGGTIDQTVNRAYMLR